MRKNEFERLEVAATIFDWGQVVSHGGVPCFHLQKDGHFCGRAQRWPGHEHADEYHAFVSLTDLLRQVNGTDRT